ncbi:MAG TPA: tetratricopeptide repeat protein [Burkholderiales bacterium]|nr:tetratricopeptide repeat protein [Burkholderiales bacterium]
MVGNAIPSLEKLLAAGKDSALLRFSLGNEYAKVGDFAMAAGHLQRAVDLDPNYSAAWKLLGLCLTELGQFQQALATYEHGIEVAEAKGDKQAAKEMHVFARRLRKRRDNQG